MRISVWLFLAAAPLLACGTGGPSNTAGSATGTVNGGTATSTAGSLPAAITTIAGKGATGEGFANGDAGTAEFYKPAGLAFDSAGNLYVADEDNNAIRKIDPSGNVSTVAGLGYGQHSLLNGGPKTAEFYSPLAVAVDSSGNIYVADSMNSAVRKIDSHGTVSTFVGPQLDSFVSSGPDALVRYPSGVAVDAAGNVYVSDSGNNAIRKVDSKGNVTTVIGGPTNLGFADGDAGTGKLQPPYGIAVDATGNIYFVDQDNNAIRKIDGQGNLSTLAGKGTSAHGFIDGAAGTAQLFQPFALCLDAAGNIYFSDQRNNAIRKIDTQGNVSTLAGHGPNSSGDVDGDAGVAALNSPTGVAVDSAGNLYFADQDNNAIRRYTP